MSFLETLPVIGSVAETIRKIVRNFVKDPNEADAAATQITVAVLDVVKQEVGSQYWLAGNWRPIVMLLIAAGLTLKAIIGSIGENTVDYVLFGILMMGLMGYKLDGKILEFLAQAFAFGKKESRNERKNQADFNPSASKTGG